MPKDKQKPTAPRRKKKRQSPPEGSDVDVDAALEDFYDLQADRDLPFIGIDDNIEINEKISPQTKRLIGRLDELEQALLRVLPHVKAVQERWVRHTAGNHGPSATELPPLSAEIIEENLEAIRLAREEVGQKAPNTRILRVCGSMLKQIAAHAKAFVDWMRPHAEIFADSFAKKAGECAATTIFKTVPELAAIAMVAASALEQFSK